MTEAGGPQTKLESVRDLKTDGDSILQLRLYRPFDLPGGPALALILSTVAGTWSAISTPTTAYAGG